MRALFLLLGLFLAAPALSVTANAADGELVIRESKYSVKETIDRLAKDLASKGVKVAARIDHSAGAKSVGMELKPAQVLVFGNPKLGTPLMQAAPMIGLDLPMKMLAWQDANGKVWLAYASADALMKRYGVKGKDQVFKTMAGALDKFATAASGNSQVLQRGSH
ncbi:MAG: DUF302 domain-containing protein [Hyphomicrobiaceae bacterium]